MRRNLTGTRAAIAALSSALALAGCAGGLGGPETGAGQSTSTLASLLAFNSTQPPPLAATPPKVEEIVCPHVEIMEGASAVRVGGQTNQEVKYQYSINHVARECTLIGNQISIKVGVEGRVLLGPAGAPGPFQIPVRFAIRRESDQSAAASQFQKLAASVPAGSSEVGFSTVSEAMLIPNTGETEDQDFTVLVGFDTGAAIKGKPKAKRRARRSARR